MIPEKLCCWTKREWALAHVAVQCWWEAACSLGCKKDIICEKTCDAELQSQIQDDGEVVVQLSPAVGENWTDGKMLSQFYGCEFPRTWRGGMSKLSRAMGVLRAPWGWWWCKGWLGQECKVNLSTWEDLLSKRRRNGSTRLKVGGQRKPRWNC